MDELVLTFAGACAALILNFAIKAVLYRIKKGKFRTVGSKGEGSAFGFETDYGNFILSPSKSALFYDGSGGSGMRFAFSEIKRVALLHSDESSLLGEFVFGLDLWDLFKSNRDTVQWRMLALEMASGEKLPVFVAGQYVRREIFLGWWFNFEKDFLERIGVLKSIDDRLWEVSHEIETMLRQVGAIEKMA